MNPIQAQAAYRYLNAIRNAQKRRYGFAYLAHLSSGSPEPESRMFQPLSVMDEQAVRMRLQDILTLSDRA